MNYTKKNKGFTLIELIIALSIVSILSLTFFSILNFSIRYNIKNEKDIKALNIAQSEIENLRKEIKLSKSEIVISNLDNNSSINIPNTSEIIWKGINDGKNTDMIEIKEDGIYKEYIAENPDGSKDINTLQYIRTVDGDNTPYIVKLNLTRQKKASKFLYNIEVKVSTTNKNLSKKEAILNTSVLSK